MGRSCRAWKAVEQRAILGDCPCRADAEFHPNGVKERCGRTRQPFFAGHSNRTRVNNINNYPDQAVRDADQRRVVLT